MSETSNNINYTTRINEVSANLSYVGESPNMGAFDDKPVWRIKKIETTGTVTTVLYADGNDYFDNVWDDHLTLTYI